MYSATMVKIIQKITRGDITRIILEVTKVSGLLATGLLAPNVLGSLAKMGIIKTHHRQTEVINRTRNNLVKSGHLEKNTQGFLILTQKGRGKLETYKISQYNLTIPKIWDKKWRILIFDIPEYRKSLREKLRNTLTSIGFKRIQDSVWIFPYDCEELITLLKTDFKVGKDLLYMEVEKIENDKTFRTFFNLHL